MIMKSILLLFISSIYLFAGVSGKYIQKATSKPISVIEENKYYLGVGFGKFKLKNRDMNENLKSNIISLIAGYNISNYLSLEFRYYKGVSNLTYHSLNKSKKIDSKYSNYSIFVKTTYPIENFNPYILFGYGVNKISNLSNSDRKESNLEYGLGISYKVNNNISIFADYIRAYNKKGFDGRATQDRLRANLITIGATYHF